MPRCSVVIPVLDLASVTRSCLESLLGTPPRVSHEVIVVDDGSTDTTPHMLSAYAERVRVLTNAENQGFATACNRGAEMAEGEFVVFLNNDTLPQPGWLDALVDHADRHPRAGAVGGKLLFPDGTIQHAGVAICHDRVPRHLYAGFPGDHPAVNRPRLFQAVTAACLLVRRDLFRETGGFDRAFRNGLEDVDLCLRLGEAGFEIHYCPESVVHHHESATRDPRGRAQIENLRLYRDRWAERVRPDDLGYYLDDGLLEIDYQEEFPVRFRLSPLLGVVSGDERHADQLLDARARQVGDLLRENLRLSVQLSEVELRLAEATSREGELRALLGAAQGQLLARDQELRAAIHEVQASLAETRSSPTPAAPERSAPAPDWNSVTAKQLRYQQLIQQVRGVVERAVPVGATLLVVSKGDDELVRLGGRSARHFPQAANGGYAGHHPGSGAEAIAQLETLRQGGAEYLLLPSTSFWWLEHYPELFHHLESRYTIAHQDGSCIVYALRRVVPEQSRAGAADADRDPRYARLLAQIQALANSLLPPQAHVLVVSKGDDALLELRVRRARHFPQAENGGYAGHHPGSGAEAIAQLETLRQGGAEYLLLPSTSFWWLEHYPEFALHLESTYRVVTRQEQLCVIYSLQSAELSRPTGIVSAREIAPSSTVG